jgi:hypothetical protein
MVDTAVSVARIQAEADKFKAELGLVKDLTGEARDVLVQMLKAATSNPVIGIIGAVIIVDLLHQAKILSPVGYTFCMITLGIVEASYAATVLSQITAGTYDFTSILGGVDVSRPSPNLTEFSPTATTVVFGDDVQDGDFRRATPAISPPKSDVVPIALQALKALPEAAA